MHSIIWYVKIGIFVIVLGLFQARARAGIIGKIKPLNKYFDKI
jgi:hypothetical protein